MTTILRGRRIAAPLILAVGLAACRDGPTGPSRTTPAPRPGLSTASAYDAGAGTITLYADDGFAYTLVAAASEIRVNNGMVIQLTAEELANAVNAFVAAHEAAQQGTALAHSSPPNLACELGWETCNRDDLFSIPPDGDDLAIPGPVVSPPPELLDGGGTRLQEYPSCRDIAVAIYDATATAKETRRELESVVRSVARPGVTPSADGIHVRLINVPGAALRLEVAGAAQATAAVRLNILASLYSAYYCWNGAWPGAVGSTTVPVGPGFVKTCQTSRKEVQLPDGTIIETEVTTCVVKMQ